MIDQYYKNEPMDDLNKALFAFASYNAGPNRIRSCARRPQTSGSIPTNGSTTSSGSLRRMGRETVQYVSNIYKYYVAYRLVMAQRESRGLVKPTTN